MSTRHQSFTLSRPGLKSGHYVPMRLRVADTVAVFSGVPMVIAIIALAMISFRWADRFGLGVIWRNTFAFYAYVIIVLVIARWAVCFSAVGVLRFLFRLTGMMTEEEAKSFPLSARKGRVDPWPESWQRPCAPLPSTHTPPNQTLNRSRRSDRNQVDIQMRRPG